MAQGKDSGYLLEVEMGMLMLENQAMYDASMAPMEVILTAKRDRAYMCRHSDILSALEVGKYAHVLVVEGDSLAGLSLLTGGLSRSY